LLFDDKEEPLKNNAFTNNRHPRTCACITKTKEILLITVDGRNAEAQGMSLQELTFLTKTLDVKMPLISMGRLDNDVYQE
jgi:exopolysaccharide biosynthesis protein